MTLEAGVLLGRYEIVELCGKGGMGEVYRARDPRLRREVALKVLAPGLVDSESGRNRFEREARTIAGLQHPHICMLLDVGTEGPTQYLVMEYLHGETLESRLRAGALSIEVALRIALAITRAVDTAHRKGIVHRDLKPGNVMLADTGVKVLDFGLAREICAGYEGAESEAATATAVTRSGALLGTVPYMAPEQLRGEPEDARTDIWALGCVIYEMVSGVRPFGGRSQADLIGEIMGKDPEPPSRRQPSSPRTLDVVVARCLEKKPEQRWQAASELAYQLEELLGGGDRAAPLDKVVPSELDSEAVAGQPGSLAVFPFDNDTGDARFDQLAKGIAEEVNGLHAAAGTVVPRSRVFTHLDDDPCEAAAKMGARFALSGSLQGDGTRLRVFAELFNCPEAEVLWSDRFVFVVGDVFELQREVAQRIFGPIPRLLRLSYEADQRRGTVDWYLRQRSPEANAQALQICRVFIGRAPDRAPWGALHRIYMQAFLEGWWEEPDSLLAEMNRVSEASLPVNSNERNWLSGYTHLCSGRGDKAVLAFERALELSKGSAWLYGPLGRAQALAGKPELACESIGRAMSLSPNDDFVTNWYNVLAIAHFALGDYEGSRGAALQSVRTNSNNEFNRIADGYELLAASNSLLGHHDQASQALGDARRLRPALSRRLVQAVYASAQPDHRDRYLTALARSGLDE